MGSTMIDVGLVQINVDFDSIYLPYAVGLLQAYAETHEEIRQHFRFRPALFRRERDPDKLVAALDGASLVAFSSYVWNTRYSLEVARRFKARNPDSLVLFGGPNAPDRAESFLRANPCVDIALHGEGEVAFRDFLLAYKNGDWTHAPSIRYVDRRTGEYVARPLAARLKELGLIPSPYTAGVFDEIMRREPNERWNALWETNRGCPFACTYCDWGSATQSKVNRFPMERLHAEIEWFRDKKIEYVMCADANFGILERDVELAESLAAAKGAKGYPQVFAATYTKNATERSYRMAQLLTKAGLIRGYTVSTQSVDETTLKNIKRDNISQQMFTTLQARFNQDKLPTYTDLIIALPGETYESFTRGVAEVVGRGQHNKIYFLILSLLPNAPMSDPAYLAQHGVETVWVPQRNLHERIKEDPSEVVEYQELIIATKTMNRADWRRCVHFGWMVSFIHFDKLLHIPLTVLAKTSGIDIRRFGLAFQFDEDRPEFPFLSKINRFFREKALAIQGGECEYCESKDWLRVWWQPDKLAFMEACKAHEAFYAEAETLLERVLVEAGAASSLPVLRDALTLNRALLRSPFAPGAESVELDHNILEHYKGILEQRDVALEAGHRRYVIDGAGESWPTTDDWCKQVVWYGNKTSAYLRHARPDVPAATSMTSPPPDPVHIKPYLFG